MKFYTPYIRPEPKPEMNDGKTQVETAGVLSPKRQIENLLMAGKRLEEFRKEAYDFETDEAVDMQFSDPTRSPNFDLADASQLQQEVEKNLKLRKGKKGTQKSSASPNVEVPEEPELEIEDEK